MVQRKAGGTMNANIKKVVYDILANDKESRCDDMYLLARVIETVCEMKPHTDLLIHQLEQWRFEGLPNFNTVIRARRKLQVEFPELIDEETAKRRAEEEAKYFAEYGKKESA